MRRMLTCGRCLFIIVKRRQICFDAVVSSNCCTMHGIADLLGDTVISNTGSVSTHTIAGEGRVIGLYFSAHWCPPCRAFTPQLVDWFKTFQAQAARGKDLDIIFVSSDKDEQTFLEYFKQMPWYSLPFTERDKKDQLSKKFKVQGIPALVFIDGTTGKLITSDGRNFIVEDPKGVDFPWHPKPLSQILCGKLRKQDGEVSCSEALDRKVKGLYFSAHWCPPCRSFTEQLIQTYTALHERHINFEVVFVSVDRSKESYTEYYKSMPWLALPFGDERGQQLTRHFGVQGIPALVLLDENNELITTTGRTVIVKDPEGKEFPWPIKPLEELNEVTANLLNEATCFVMFTDGDEKLIREAQHLLQDVAHSYKAEQKSSVGSAHELPPVYFLYEGIEGEEIAGLIHNFAHLEDFSPLLVVLDVPNQRVYCHPSDKLYTDVVERLVADFKANKLPFRKLRH